MFDWQPAEIPRTFRYAVVCGAIACESHTAARRDQQKGFSSRSVRRSKESIGLLYNPGESPCRSSPVRSSIEY